MLPEDHSSDPAAQLLAGRAARTASSKDALLREEDGITVWRGFDPQTVGTGISLARATFAPGTRMAPHWHSQDTVAYLVDGRAVLRSGAEFGDVLEIEPGDWLFVPAGLVHDEFTPDDIHCEFLYARDGAGGTTTFVDD
jgi:uncharacterized RmlC-like cupin family protein